MNHFEIYLQNSVDFLSTSEAEEVGKQVTDKHGFETKVVSQRHAGKNGCRSAIRNYFIMIKHDGANGTNEVWGLLHGDYFDYGHRNRTGENRIK